MVILMRFVANLAATFVATLYGGWVTTVLWGWYAVPLGYAPITLRTGVGAIFVGGLPLAAVVGMLAVTRMELNELRGESKPHPYETFRMGLMFTAIYTSLLFCGWFYNLIL